jgi:uncharacterized phage-associated protein
LSGNHDPRALANAFIDRFVEKGLVVTHMQLQKMVYFAHAWSLAIFDRPLSRAYFSAWKWGPVNTQIYNKFKKFGSLPITDKAVDGTTGLPYVSELSSDDVELIDRVFKTYGSLSGPKLSQITHIAGSPWDKVYSGGQGEGNSIPDSFLKEYFSTLDAKSA